MAASSVDFSGIDDSAIPDFTYSTPDGLLSPGLVPYSAPIGESVSMSTSTVDLSNLQTINFGGGQTGSFDPTSGTYYDSGGNVLSAGDLAQYGAFTVGSPGAFPAPPPGGGSTPGMVNPSGNGAMLSGVSGIFSSFGNAMANTFGAVRPTIQTPTQGTLVYNPATGGYTTATAMNASSTMTPLLLLALAGVVIYLVVKG